MMNWLKLYSIHNMCIYKSVADFSNIAINMVVALQPKFHSKQVMDEFVDEANLIRQQNKLQICHYFACDNSNKYIDAIYYPRLKGRVFAVWSIGPLPASWTIRIFQQPLFPGPLSTLHMVERACQNGPSRATWCAVLRSWSTSSL